jgi:hypothetical protein
LVSSGTFRISMSAMVVATFQFLNDIMISFGALPGP